MDGLFITKAKGGDNNSSPLSLKGGNSLLVSTSKGMNISTDNSERNSDYSKQASSSSSLSLKGTQITSGGVATNNVGFMKKSIGDLKSPFTPPLKGTQVSLGAANNIGTGLPFMKKSIGEMKSPLSSTPPAIPLLSTPQLKGKDSFIGAKVGSGLPFKQKTIDEINTIMTPDSISIDSDTSSNDVVTINDKTDAEKFLSRQTVESTDKKIGTGASFDSTVSFTPPQVRYEPVFVDVEIEVIDDPNSSDVDDMDNYSLQKDRNALGKQTTQPMNLWSGESFYGTSSSRVYGIRSSKSGGSSKSSRVTKDRSDTVDDVKDSDEIAVALEQKKIEQDNSRRIDDERRIIEEKTRVANLFADAEAKLAQQLKEMEDERRQIKYELERVAQEKVKAEKRALELENTRAIEVRALEERLAEERSLTKRKLKEEQDKYLKLERAREMDVENINQLLEKRLDARIAELKKEQSSLVVGDGAAGNLVLNNEDIAEIVGNPNDLSTNSESASADDVSDTLAADVEQLQIVSLDDTEFDLNGPIDNQLSTSQGESEMKYPFVSLLRDSSPYIVNHRHSTIVYHIPGDLISSSARFNSVMDDISLTYLFGMKIVIVVGCRKQILGRLATSTTTVDGYGQSRTLDIRVTDAETLRIVEEEAGYCRFEVERMLNRCLRNKGADCNIVSGCFITAKKFGIVDSVDYEFTGYPKTLQTDRINKFHARNDVVLLTPLGFTKDGDALNVHSEALAAFTAGALEASKLVYFSSKPMILRGSIDAHSKQRLQMITRGIATQIMSHYGLSIDSKTGFPYWGNDIHEMADSLDSDQRSMILKIGWAVHAIENGVERAHIISSEDGALLEELFTARQGYGTCISQDDYEAPHVKDWNDDLGIAYGLSEAGVVKL
jgi:amino-acid N-acetyltransferase